MMHSDICSSYLWFFGTKDATPYTMLCVALLLITRAMGENTTEIRPSSTSYSTLTTTTQISQADWILNTTKSSKQGVSLSTFSLSAGNNVDPYSSTIPRSLSSTSDGSVSSESITISTSSLVISSDLGAGMDSLTMGDSLVEVSPTAMFNDQSETVIPTSKIFPDSSQTVIPSSPMLQYSQTHDGSVLRTNSLESTWIPGSSQVYYSFSTEMFNSTALHVSSLPPSLSAVSNTSSSIVTSDFVLSSLETYPTATYSKKEISSMETSGISSTEYINVKSETVIAIDSMTESLRERQSSDGITPSSSSPETSLYGSSLVQPTVSSSFTEESTTPSTDVTSQASNEKAQQMGLGAGEVAGITIGCLVFLAIVAAVVFICYRRSRRQEGSLGSRRDSSLKADIVYNTYWDEDSTLNYRNSRIELPNDYSAEMISLDNDAFLRSLEESNLVDTWTSNAAKNTTF